MPEQTALLLVRAAAIGVAVLLVSPSLGAESDIIKAINSGAISSDSKLALPEQGNTPASTADAASGPSLLSITKKDEENISNRAFPLMTAKWPFNIAFVCWENPSDGDYEKREIVRRAVNETWQANSGLKFMGWNACQKMTTGIRIRIEDSGPNVKFLGKYVDAVKDGMTLNFTFNKWSTSCKTKIDYCIRTIAVHEFGHAIGFAHEQNRPDTPGECYDPPQGANGDTMLSPWDPNSVMNYCNETYNNNGLLSEFDVKAVQYVYGVP